jgi:hypothetical protein
MTTAQSREYQLHEIRKLERESRSATPERQREIEAEISTRTQDIRRLEELLRQQQEQASAPLGTEAEYAENAERLQHDQVCKNDLTGDFDPYLDEP